MTLCRSVQPSCPPLSYQPACDPPAPLSSRPIAPKARRHASRLARGCVVFGRPVDCERLSRVPIERPLGEPIYWTEARRAARCRWAARTSCCDPSTPSRRARCTRPRIHPAATPRSGPTCPTAHTRAREHMRQALAWAQSTDDPLFTIAPLPDQRPLGLASYLRIAPEHGVIEIGHIWFAASCSARPRATEAIYLLARHAFDELGYRRLEWKCDALNAAPAAPPSASASPSRGSSASTWSSRAATATPPGTRSPTGLAADPRRLPSLAVPRELRRPGPPSRRRGS